MQLLVVHSEGSCPQFSIRFCRSAGPAGTLGEDGLVWQVGGGMPNPVIGSLSDDDTLGHRHALGREGERLAAQLLEEKGLTVLERNWKCRHGELDIIATDRRRAVFCEVKARSGVDYGGPLLAVGPDKVRRVRRLAQLWLNERELTGCPVRFDVISVLWPPGGKPRLEHLEGVF